MNDTHSEAAVRDLHARLWRARASLWPAEAMPTPVEMLDPAGKPDGRVDAESCLYDRNAKRGYCPSAVRLVRTNATISPKPNPPSIQTTRISSVR